MLQAHSKASLKAQILMLHTWKFYSVKAESLKAQCGNAHSYSILQLIDPRRVQDNKNTDGLEETLELHIMWYV